MTMSSICALVATVATMTSEAIDPVRSGAPLTITVRSLRAQSEGAEMLLQILLEDGEHREHKTLILTTEQYCELKPQRGVISEEAYERLEEAAQLCRALRSGENLLSYGSNSVQMLSRKLMQRGYSREVATLAAEHLELRGLINEERDMQREVEKCLRKLWGAKRISSHLWSRGFAADAMQGLSELLEEIDFEQNCATLIQKHYGGVPDDADDRRRMVAGLSRYGYSISEIRGAMKSLQA